VFSRPFTRLPQRKWLLVVVGWLFLALVTAAPAGAIVGGAPDTDGHPNVGAVVAHFPDGDFPACSGTLISPSIFLTAGHCIAGTQSFGATGYAVTFDSNVAFDASGRVIDTIPGTATLDPLFGHDQGDFHDLAIITLAQPVVSAAPATLPPAGLLDRLAAKGGLRGQDFNVVGYGAPGIRFGGGRPEPIFDFVRRVATSSFMSIDPTRLFLLINTNATGGGGACFGDSGGPEFLNVDGTDVLVSLTSQKSDQVCRALDVNYRLDTPSAREFLGQFVPLP
jgi:Trypsin